MPDLPDNFHLYRIIDGMMLAAQMPETPYCGWCDKKAAILLPRDWWDQTSPLTEPACLEHGRVTALFDTAEFDSVWKDYLSVFEKEDN